MHVGIDELNLTTIDNWTYSTILVWDDLTFCLSAFTFPTLEDSVHGRSIAIPNIIRSRDTRRFGDSHLAYDGSIRDSSWVADCRNTGSAAREAKQHR